MKMGGKSKISNMNEKAQFQQWFAIFLENSLIFHMKEISKRKNLFDFDYFSHSLPSLLSIWVENLYYSFSEFSSFFLWLICKFSWSNLSSIFVVAFLDWFGRNFLRAMGFDQSIEFSLILCFVTNINWKYWLIKNNNNFSGIRTHDHQ
jgi:hypothetical protein